MPNRDFCLAKAAEAEKMMRVVSLANDKERLKTEAQQWRQRADAVQVSPPRK